MVDARSLVTDRWAGGWMCREIPFPLVIELQFFVVMSFGINDWYGTA